MKAKRAKHKQKLTDTQIFDNLLLKIDNASKITNNVVSIQTNNVLDTNSETLKTMQSFGSKSKIVFDFRHSRGRDVLNTIQLFLLDKEGNMNMELLQYIDINIKCLNNKDDILGWNSESKIVLNINPLFLKTKTYSIRVFLTHFYNIYLSQLTKLSKWSPLDYEKDILGWFMKESKLLKWKEEFIWDSKHRKLLSMFIGEHSTRKEYLIKIMEIGTMATGEEKTLIEIAALKVLKFVNKSFLLGIYENVK